MLVDQNMPNMDGLSLIKALRTMKNYQNVPIVMLTTESGDDVKALGKAAGRQWMDGQAFRSGALDRSCQEIDWLKEQQVNGMAVEHDGAQKYDY